MPYPFHLVNITGLSISKIPYIGVTKTCGTLTLEPWVMYTTHPVHQLNITANIFKNSPMYVSYWVDKYLWNFKVVILTFELGTCLLQHAVSSRWTKVHSHFNILPCMEMLNSGQANLDWWTLAQKYLQPSEVPNLTTISRYQHFQLQLQYLIHL